MTLTNHELRTALKRERVLAIIRGHDPDAAVRTIGVLVESGIRAIEVSLTTTDALGVIAAAVREHGDGVLLGAGTVLTGDDLSAVLAVGASFVVTPGACEGLDRAIGWGVGVLGGALTPSEVLAVHQTGAIVKVFPVEQVGGAGYVRSLRGPFPDIGVVGVGGVGPTEARDLLDAGALAVGVGAPLVGDAADGGDLEALRERADAFVALAGETRS